LNLLLEEYGTEQLCLDCGSTDLRGDDAPMETFTEIGAICLLPNKASCAACRLLLALLLPVLDSDFVPCRIDFDSAL